jgi:hypothetical protein
MEADREFDWELLGASRGEAKRLLAVEAALGHVYACNRCGDIHVRLNSLDFRMEFDVFQALVLMLNRAAANCELWLETRGGRQ